MKPSAAILTILSIPTGVYVIYGLVILFDKDPRLALYSFGVAFLFISMVIAFIFFLWWLDEKWKIKMKTKK